MSQKAEFYTLIDYLKANKKVELSNLKGFEKLFSEIKNLHSTLRINSDTRNTKTIQFIKCLTQVELLKKTVYTKRYKETEAILLNNADEIYFSAFELMEHNYRENSHSNILRYLFHHRFWKLGSAVLSQFVLRNTKDSELSDLILKNNYDIHREYFTRNGRIDLLIEDKKNKFVIVIENKILANISVKEYAEDNTVSKTQLHNYIEYISNKFIDYKVSYILLSLYPDDELDYQDFIRSDYDDLLEVLNEIETDNNIVKEYRTLLRTIINYHYDKEWLLELNNKFENKKNIKDLNTFELANKYFQ